MYEKARDVRCQHIGKCLAVCSLFHGNIGYIYYPAVVSVLVPMVEHSVKTQRHLLVCLFFSLSPTPFPPLHLPHIQEKGEICRTEHIVGFLPLVL